MHKLMRRAFVLLIAVVMAAFTAISASAANFTSQADALNAMGLFRGSSSGSYNLDQPSTRAQAATMLVRLLGKEQDALSGNYSVPFTDIPSWADKYVGYLYSNGLIKGTSDTMFSPNVNCNVTMYTVFVLRSLGYSETNGDFTYTGALNFATELGLIDASMANKNTFLRDDMVAISYSALFQHPKGVDSETLLDKLVAANAVNADVASRYLDTYKTFKDYIKDTSSSTLTLPAQLQEAMTLQMSVAGQTLNATANKVTTIAKSGDGNIMKTETTTNMLGETVKSTSYFANGWVYEDSDQGKFKYQSPTPSLDSMLLSSEIGSFYMIDSISKSVTSNGTSYTIQLSADALYGLNSILSSFGSNMSSGITMQINSASLVVNLDANGKLSSENINMDFATNITENGQTIPMQMAVQATITVTATGDGVSVTLPSDLSSYQEILN